MRLILIIYLAILTSCATKITGYVLLKNGEPVTSKNGKINISYLGNQTTAVSEILNIDDDGYFSTEKDIQNGAYLVEPLIPGYSAKSVKIRVKKDEHVKILAYPLANTKSKILSVPTNQAIDRGAGSVTITPPKF